MQQVIIETVTEKELKENNRVKDKFKEAFSMRDIGLMKEILHDEGVFFGRWNKGRCVNQLCATYHPGNFIEGFIGEQVNEGVSLDSNPNELTLEFRFYDFDAFMRSEHPDDEVNFQDPPRQRLSEIMFHFTLRFKEGKIYGIRRPKKVIADVKKLMAEN